MSLEEIFNIEYAFSIIFYNVVHMYTNFHTLYNKTHKK